MTDNNPAEFERVEGPIGLVSYGPSLYGLGEILSVTPGPARDPEETAMTDLITWLRVQLDEDERGCRFALQAGGTGHWSEPTSGALLLEGVKGMDGLFGVGDTRLVRHMVEWDPARVLAEVEAKRRILDLHQRVDARDDWFGRGRVGWPPEPACYGCHANFGEEYAEPDANKCPVVRLLALPFSDRPGYDETWRPA